MKIRIIRQLGGLSGRVFKEGDIAEAQVYLGGQATTEEGQMLPRDSYVPHLELDAVNEWAWGLSKEEHG